MPIRKIAAHVQLAIVPFLCILLVNTNAQINPFNKQEVNIASIQTEFTLSPQQYEVATSTVAILNPNDIAGLHYKNTNAVLPASGKLRGNTNSVNIYIKALFTNTSDTVYNVFFYPGYYFKSIFLFKQSTDAGSNIQTVPGLLPNFKYKESYRGIILQPKEKSYFYIQLQPVKIQVNTFNPELINPAFLSAHAARVREDNNQISIFTYIIVGILGMMFIFSFANFIVTGKKEFLFYCLYILSNAGILFGKTYMYLSTSDFNYFFEEYLDFMLLLTGIVFYIYFLRYFLEINSQSNRLLYRVLISIEVLAIIFSFVYTFTYFLSDTITGLAMMEMIMKYVILLTGFLFIIIGIRQRNKLMNYIVLGNVCVMVFGFVSLTIVVAPVQQSLVLSNALFYYEMGLVGELAFFLLGLTYKSRTELINKVKTEDAVSHENEKKNFEKQLAIIQARQEERNRISADMHDELGGGMTAIRLMSELAKQRIHTGDMPEIEKISASANDLLSKMNAIIWSMSPANDTLPNLIAYIRSYAFEFFENSSIECRVNVCEDIPAIEVTGVKRRNIFLAVKEALSNVAQHAGADTVIVNIICDKNLKISIADNGKGIPPKEMELMGIGLSNMQKRMESVQGWFQVKNENGTIVILEIPF
ncbi:MAG: hypothetical protein IT249_17980 [Chitinophagaceae bacterium]|nr:hypothetical protein [Chitinophagaceae bacterium]